MKKICFPIFIALLLSGCCILPPRGNTLILLSSKPPSLHSFIQAKPEKKFHKGQKIFFAVYAKNGFPSEQTRIQILKKNDKACQYGYSLEHARDIQIDLSQKYFTNSFHIYNKGAYLFRIFTVKNKGKPLAQTFFKVNNE